MYILIGIIFIIIGIVMLMSPKTIFQITESWKSISDDEPSALYNVSTRVGGVAFLIVGIASIIVSLQNLM